MLQQNTSYYPLLGPDYLKTDGNEITGVPLQSQINLPYVLDLGSAGVFYRDARGILYRVTKDQFRYERCCYNAIKGWENVNENMSKRNPFSNYN